MDNTSFTAKNNSSSTYGNRTLATLGDRKLGFQLLGQKTIFNLFFKLKSLKKYPRDLNKPFLVLN